MISFGGGLGIVVSKTIGDSGWRDVKSGSDGGGAGHVGNKLVRC